jgi:hypothetical protein
MESYSGDRSLTQSGVPAQVMKDKCFPQESPLADLQVGPGLFLSVWDDAGERRECIDKAKERRLSWLLSISS